MTAQPSSTLADDVFVDNDNDNRPGSYNTGASRQAASHSQASAPLRESNNPNAESNGALYSERTISSPVAHGNGMATQPLSTHGQPYPEAHTEPFPPALPAYTLGNPSGPLIEYSPSPLAHNNAPLSVATDLPLAPPARSGSVNSRHGGLSASQHGSSVQRKASNSNLQLVSRTPSWKQHLTRSIGSATSSAYPSPIISAMGDVTPLPSPLLSSDSPGPWKRLVHATPSRELTVPTIMPDSVLITKTGESVATALEHHSKRKVYAGLQVGHAAEHSSGKNEHTRNRSISEYIPDAKGILKRQNTVSNGKVDERNREDPAGLRREPRLSGPRGLAVASKPPTPPPSESSQNNDTSVPKGSSHEYFEAVARKDQKLRRWRAIKDLGEGTFSRVVLATSKIDDKEANQSEGSHRAPKNPPTPVAVSQLDRKTLVAIKICEHGPKGGASEDRIEMSLKRELDILQSIDHPSLVHLKAWQIEPTRALLVLNYSPGGDLFDVASNYRDSLSAAVLRRIFSELVGAVAYLHERRIVHRDIKLESK